MAPLKKESKKATSAGRAVSEKHRQNKKIKTNAALTQDAYKKHETASKSRKLTKASIPKEIKLPTSWAQQAESEDNKIRWGPELPTPAQIGQLHGREEGRNLTSWREHRMLERLLVTIDTEAKSEGIELPWDKIAHRLNPGMGPQAVQQFMERTFNSLLSEGHLVPPPFRKHQAFAPEIRGFARDDNAQDGVRPVPYWEDYKNPTGPKKGSSRSTKKTPMAQQTEDAQSENETEAQDLPSLNMSASPAESLPSATTSLEAQNLPYSGMPASPSFSFFTKTSEGQSLPSASMSPLPGEPSSSFVNSTQPFGTSVGSATANYPMANPFDNTYLSMLAAQGFAGPAGSSLPACNNVYAAASDFGNEYQPTQYQHMPTTSSVFSQSLRGPLIPDYGIQRHEDGPSEEQQINFESELDELRIRELAGLDDMTPEEAEIVYGGCY